MATFTGAVRSYTAAVRRAERTQQRNAREAARRYKLVVKENELLDAAICLADYNKYLKMLLSTHKDCTEGIDWHRVAAAPPPTQAAADRSESEAARMKLERYQPNFVVKMFGREEAQRKALATSLAKAEHTETQRQAELDDQLAAEQKVWAYEQRLAGLVESGDANIYQEVLAYFEPLSDVEELGTRIQITRTGGYLDVDLSVQSADIVPDFDLKLLASGKLSRKAMTASRYNEIYQDYVCSTMLRVARELFAYLPDETMRISAFVQMLNGATGHLEMTPIVSALIPRRTLDQLNLQQIDPSDSFRNFSHRMQFQKTKGFGAVERVGLV